MKAYPWLGVLALGVMLNWGAYRLEAWLRRESLAMTQEAARLEGYREKASQTLLLLRAVREMKERDMAVFKASLGSVAQAKKALYESGLALQEEKRLLEKLLEIMTTSIRIELESEIVSLMREDHSLVDFPVVLSSSHPVTEQLMKSTNLRITSKERFAHPERGKFEEKDGVLIWNPPQVGQSVRSNALGEFVIFTNSNLIIHGPYKQAAEHDAYPHACLCLSLSHARKLYRASFIGNHVGFKTDW